jgi:hypothetical protein
MACWETVRVEQTQAERDAEIAEALAELERKLLIGEIRIGISPEGAIVFEGWEQRERAGVSDVCAFERLSQQDSAALMTAVQTAEALYGRSVDREQIKQGVHSHDGGATWSTH